MLPFLQKPRASGGVITEIRPSDHKDEPQDDTGLMAAAKDLVDAHDSKDIKRVAAALRAAFQILDSEPHDEGEDMSDQEPQE